METLEQLKEIVKNSPEGATHYTTIEKVYYKFKSESWMWCPDGNSLFHFVQDDDSVCDNLRSLSDIKLIIELTEERNGLKHKVGYVIEQPHSKDNYDLGA